MSDEPVPILEAVAVLRATGIAVVLISDELESWQIGELTFSDPGLRRRVESRGMMVSSVDA